MYRLCAIIKSNQTAQKRPVTVVMLNLHVLGTGTTNSSTIVAVVVVVVVK